MENKINSDKFEVINFKNIVNIFKKRKKIFIYSSLIVLVISLCITFLIPKEYASKSTITITSNFYYGQLLSKYFPQEFDKLWIIRDNNVKDDRINRLHIIENNLKSDSFLNLVLSKINNVISKRNLSKAIEIEDTGSLINLTVYTTDPQLSYKINKAIIEIYSSQKYEDFYIIYKNLLQKVNDKLNLAEKNLSTLSQEAENYNLDFYSKLLKNIKKPEDKTVYFSTGHFISPELQAKINSASLEYYQLKGIQQSLVEDKDLYLNRIEVLNEPKIEDVKMISNLIRNITLSIIASVLAGCICVFIVNYFKN